MRKERTSYQVRQTEKIRLQKEIEKNRKQKAIMLLCILLLLLFWFYAYLFGKSVGRMEKVGNVQITVDEGDSGEHFSDVFAEKENSQNRAAEILLVNKENPLPDDYEVELVKLQDGVNRAAKEAYQPLSNMLKAGIKEGLTFEICSSYRDMKRQKELFEEDVEALIRQGYSYQEAYDEVAKETMPPGCSEHSTGLAFDIVAFDYQMLDEKQANTDESIWLRKHCAEYGFILRYPEGKEDITGISYESWHFRYVGKEAAQYIMQEGITLEEYMEKV